MNNTESTAPLEAGCALTAADVLTAAAVIAAGAELAGFVVGCAATDSTLTWATAAAVVAAGSPIVMVVRPSVAEGVATFLAGLEFLACGAVVVTPVSPLRGEAEPADGAAKRALRLRAEAGEAGAAPVES